MQTVTVFKSLFDNHPKYYDVKFVLETFRRSRPEIDQIRLAKDEEERERLKKNLPGVLFTGEFTERKASAMKSYSRLIILDFDKLANPTNKKRELSLLPFIYATWLSPTGTGVKALVKVASDNHLGHYLALSKEFKDLDVSGKDVSRFCFVSYDPELYINEAADVYGKVVETAYTDEQKLEKLKKWLENKGEAFVSGNRNNFLAKLCGATNRFGLSRKFVEEMVVRDYCGSDFSEREALQVVNSIYTNYADVHGTASFDDSFSQEEVKDILSAEVPVSDIILLDDIRQDMLNDYDNGTQGGTETYFPGFDNHFKWMKGELTTLTGVSSAGKSSVLMQLLLFKAVFEKQKFAFVSLETYPPTFFYKELIRTLIGKTLKMDDPDRMTRDEFVAGMEFVKKHFFFIYPEKSAPTPEWSIARFTEAHLKFGLDGVIVDPFNSQTHDYKSAGGRDDRYIADMLRKYQRFALQNKLYFVEVAHPKGIGKNEDGTYKEPTADEISGGPSFWQCSDNVLVFHRPTLPLDYLNTTCTLRSLKVKKSQINGIPGMTTLQYDLKTGRYYEDGYNPLLGFKL